MDVYRRLPDPAPTAPRRNKCSELCGDLVNWLQYRCKCKCKCKCLRKATMPGSDYTIGDCPVCLEDKVKLVKMRGCSHSACESCFLIYLKTHLKDINKYPRVCFQVGCDVKLDYIDVYNILNPAMLQDYDRMLAMAIFSSENICTCPECGTISTSGSSSRSRCSNRECNLIFCSSCMIKWHENETCQEYIRRTTHGEFEKKMNEEKFQQLIKKEQWQKCPRCGATIAKTGGCNHMKHQNCPGYGMKTTHFCYCCSQQLTTSGRQEIGSGRSHFPSGVFCDCGKGTRVKGIQRAEPNAQPQSLLDYVVSWFQ